MLDGEANFFRETNKIIFFFSFGQGLAIGLLREIIGDIFGSMG